jgi:hypothetical protein
MQLQIHPLGRSKGTSPLLIGKKAYLIPCCAFSFVIRFSKSEAGLSFGSCETSFPRTAKSKTNFRNRAIASGASAIVS